VLQNSAWLVLLTVITGDFSGAGELLLTVPLMVGQMAYSRDFERQADAFAIDTLLMAGISPDRLASILEKLEGSSEVSDGQPRRNREDGRWARDLFEYFSTHPATRERVAAIRNRANETP
jgi:predicted Zn-dependent protease